MKKLGLIGGTGPESTVAYYKALMYGVQQRSGVFPRLCIESLSVFEVLKFCKAQNYAGLADYLLQGLNCLAQAGADFACFTGITPHLVFEEVASRSPLPLVSIVESSCEHAQQRGYRKVALLGTLPTMSGTFFQRVFRGRGIEALTPTAEEMSYIGEKIETEVELGQIVPATQQRLVEICRRLMAEEGAQAVVLGCTELPLILNETLVAAPCLDVMAIHIRKLLDMLTAP